MKPQRWQFLLENLVLFIGNDRILNPVDYGVELTLHRYTVRTDKQHLPPPPYMYAEYYSPWYKWLIIRADNGANVAGTLHTRLEHSAEPKPCPIPLIYSLHGVHDKCCLARTGRGKHTTLIAFEIYAFFLLTSVDSSHSDNFAKIWPSQFAAAPQSQVNHTNSWGPRTDAVSCSTLLPYPIYHLLLLLSQSLWKLFPDSFSILILFSHSFLFSEWSYTLTPTSKICCFRSTATNCLYVALTHNQSETHIIHFDLNFLRYIYILAGWYVECAIIFIGHIPHSSRQRDIYIILICLISTTKCH